MVFIVIFAAILPALVMVWLIYRKDKQQPEPVPQLLKGVLWGIVSAIVSFVFSVPLSLIFGESTGGYYFSHWRMLKDQKSMWLMHKHCSGLIAQQRGFDKYQMKAHNNPESEHEYNFNVNV